MSFRLAAFAAIDRSALRRPRAIAVAAERLGLLALFIIVTVLIFRHWLPHLGEALIGPPEDNMQDFWNTWYVAVGRQAGRFFFTDLLRFPEGASLHLHSFAYPKVFAVAVLTRLVGTETGTLVLLQNLSLLVSFPLACAGAFYLIRHLTGSAAGALLGGFVFAFNPWHVAHAMHHAGVASIEFIPPFVLCYLLALERKRVALLGLAVVFYALAALSSWYYLVHLAVFILFHGLYTAVRADCRMDRWHLGAALACPVAVAAILAPLLVPMAHAAAGLPFEAGSGFGTYAADLAGLVAFPPTHALAPLGHGLYRHFNGNAWESTVYLGLGNLALLAWACLARQSRCGPLLPYALCGVAAFCLLAAGERLQILGLPTLPLPGSALPSLPLLSIMQAPSRAIVLAYLFLAIGVAEAVRLAISDRRRPARAGLVALTALIALDYTPVRALAMTPVACPAALDLIRDDPETGFGILDLPPHGYAERNFYMLQQVCHGRPIVLGNTSRRAEPTLGDRLDTWNVDAQRTQLLAAQVKYVVVRSHAGDHPQGAGAPAGVRLPFAWAPADAPRPHYAARYRIIRESPTLTIFQVY